MYLTKMPVIEGDDYKIHQEVRRVFPGDQKVLFQQTNRLVVLSSERPPVETSNTEYVDLRSLSSVGDQHLFSIRLNAAKREKKSGKRIVVDNVTEWIQKQLDKAGIDGRYQVIPEGVRRSNRHGTIVSLFSVLVCGLLTVKDSKAFLWVLENGLGHAKGFGFGMLNVFIC